ncbi:hypothetical protein HYH03_002194 [Edaphochlamys debaryana]|uniref:Uncharacterized protein n=1 Tax=Edaphochlamys debaryana TaxID=47281 RepID=A0A835YC58_9CHLO|nr:hypothetical protein HYH03_002194 [Edaphochlamys debaryana]|eukprot:KAG2499906.1 hypothetical protein HYH03_002194 [Edaphochlamys debaryana]
MHVEAEGYLDTIDSAAVGAVVVTSIMAAVMVLMSGCRTCLEKAVDQRGKAVCGSWLWLGTQAVLCALWWIILFWLVFVIFGSCLWYGAAYTVQGVLVTTSNQIALYNSVSPPPALASPPLAPGAVAPSPSNATISPAPLPAGLCPAYCLNLEVFDFLVKASCVCNQDDIGSALHFVQKAYSALDNVVAGAFLLWVGASFLLMNAVADFAKTKRERELLLRAQRAAVDTAATHLALGTAPASGMYAAQAYQQDAMPLLAKQAQMQQALQHQQQMQMAAMMAQAQVARPPVQASGMSASASQQNLGSAV